jgi:hypothetical protein
VKSISTRKMDFGYDARVRFAYWVLLRIQPVPTRARRSVKQAYGEIVVKELCCDLKAGRASANDGDAFDGAREGGPSRVAIRLPKNHLVKRRGGGGQSREENQRPHIVCVPLEITASRGLYVNWPPTVRRLCAIFVPHAARVPRPADK